MNYLDRQRRDGGGVGRAREKLPREDCGRARRRRRCHCNDSLRDSYSWWSPAICRTSFDGADRRVRRTARGQRRTDRFLLGVLEVVDGGGRRPGGPCHGRAEELTREGTGGIGGRAIVLIMARCTSGQRNAPLTGMHVSCTNRDRPCSLCHNPSLAAKQASRPGYPFSKVCVCTQVGTGAGR